ncbi:MAG: hypothetical protein E7329_12150 [Clostridiales bacterium]|nr:hypothetical protein [Clostridiales bacterium]
MKISIQSPDRSFVVKFPTALLCNAITACLLCRKGYHSPSAQIEISARFSYPQAKQLMRCLRKCSRAMKDLPLVEIEEKSGRHIQITL